MRILIKYYNKYVLHKAQIREPRGYGPNMLKPDGLRFENHKLEKFDNIAISAMGYQRNGRKGCQEHPRTKCLRKKHGLFDELMCLISV